MCDKAHGDGVYIHGSPGGSKYVGCWVADKQHGKGREEWPDGSTFVGFYIQGLKQGKGHFKWADGSSYVGMFENNKI